MMLAMVVLALGTCPGQPPAPVSEPPAEPFRLISATPEDLGTVHGGVAVVRELRFRNTSEHALRPRISWVSCGCLQATAKPEAVSPGAEFTIRIVGTAVPAGPAQDLSAKYVVSWSVDEQLRSVEGEVVVRYSPSTDLVVRPTEIAAWCVAGEPLRVPMWVREATTNAMAPDALRPVISAGPGLWIQPVAFQDVTAPDGPSAVRAGLELGPTPPGIFDGWVSVGSAPEAAALRVPIRVRTVLPWAASPGAARLRASVGEPARAEVRLRPVGSSTELPACTLEVEPGIEGLSATIEGTTIRLAVTRLRGPDGAVVVVRGPDGALMARVPVVLWPTQRAR
ncbi:MAG: DUF1573 domain-containing protein [Leptolyngbya sp. PLA1]|nr:DUF1573 domain-containing protein [Leptolyngbya sp. PLA1]